jgi:hypothetical protein
MKITLRCELNDKVGVNVKYSNKVNGQIKLYLNNQLQTGDRGQYQNGEIARGWYNHGDLKWFAARGKEAWETKEGENELKIVFERTNVDEDATVRLSTDITDIRPEFSDCEDRKVCLGEQGLGGEWDEQPAQDLRKSIKLQWKCLNDEAMPTQAHADVCKKWSSCLKMATDSNGVPRFDTILAILKGSGADKAPSLEQFKSIQLLQEHQSPCRDPFMSDPESWDCACHDKIVEMCCPAGGCDHTGTAFSDCYNTALCTSNDVCPQWKCAVGCSSCEEAKLLETADDLISLIADSTRSKTKVGWDCG